MNGKPVWLMFFSSDLTVAIAFSQTAETTHERVNLRLDVRNKRKLERAAACEETTVSRFVLHNAVAVAGRPIEARERNVFAVAGWDAFHGALLDPCWISDLSVSKFPDCFLEVWMFHSTLFRHFLRIRHGPCCGRVPYLR